MQSKTLAVAINIHKESIVQVEACLTRVKSNLGRATVGVFLDGGHRPEVHRLVRELGFFLYIGQNLGMNSTWNLWWSRMLYFFEYTKADVCFKFDPDTMVDKSPQSIPDYDYFGTVWGDFIQGGVTGLSQSTVIKILECKLLDNALNSHPWLIPLSNNDTFIDDQLLAKALKSIQILPQSWSECNSVWRDEVKNDPILYSIIHPRYYR